MFFICTNKINKLYSIYIWMKVSRVNMSNILKLRESIRCSCTVDGVTCLACK